MVALVEGVVNASDSYVHDVHAECRGFESHPGQFFL